MKLKQLLCKAEVSRVFPKLLFDRIRDALAQLSRRGVGEGHDEQARNVGRRVLVDDALDHATGQGRGLSGARGGGQKKGSVSLADRGALRLGPFSLGCHGGLLSF